MDNLNPFRRFQVVQKATVQTIDGRQHFLPLGFAEVEHRAPGMQIIMPLEHIKFMVTEDEITRLIQDEMMREL